MNSSRPSQHRRGQALLLDSVLAALLALTLLVAGMHAVSSAAESAKQSQETISEEAKAISLADWLIKEGAIFTTGSPYGPISHTHEIDEEKLNSLDLHALAERIGTNDVCAEFLRTNQPQSCSGRACIRRPAVLHSPMEAGYLVTCIG